MGGFENGHDPQPLVHLQHHARHPRQPAAASGATRSRSTTPNTARRVEFPRSIIDKANDFFLGPKSTIPAMRPAMRGLRRRLARLYTPLTPAEYASITALSTYRPKTWVNNFSATVNTTELFQLPAGPVGFAAVAEIGNSGLRHQPRSARADPILCRADRFRRAGHAPPLGRRRRSFRAGARFPPARRRAAGATTITGFAGNGFGKFTYNLGAELPARSTAS